jgi:hypothetical protein
MAHLVPVPDPSLQPVADSADLLTRYVGLAGHASVDLERLVRSYEDWADEYLRTPVRLFDETPQSTPGSHPATASPAGLPNSPFTAASAVRHAAASSV